MPVKTRIERQSPPQGTKIRIKCASDTASSMVSPTRSWTLEVAVDAHARVFSQQRILAASGGEYT